MESMEYNGRGGVKSTEGKGGVESTGITGWGWRARRARGVVKGTEGKGRGWEHGGRGSASKKGKIYYSSRRA